MTTFNQAPYIGDALSSVLGRIYKPYEIIVVDDGSTDATPHRIAPFLDRFQCIRQVNQGVPASRNMGVCMASGGLVAFLGADDFWVPEHIFAQLASTSSNRLSLIVIRSSLS